MANVKHVRIVVASLDNLTERCKAGEFLPTDILIDADPEKNVPFQCPAAADVEEHDANLHDDFPQTLLEISHSNKESVRWYCDSHDFKIHHITLVGTDPTGRVPNSPFPYLDIGKPPAKELLSGKISTAAITHQYKIHLKIGDRLIDPDVWCSY